MDEDLANIIAKALDRSEKAGRDSSAQAEHAAQTVRALRPDLSPLDIRNAINLVRGFLAR